MARVVAVYRCVCTCLLMAVCAAGVCVCVCHPVCRSVLCLVLGSIYRSRGGSGLQAAVPDAGETKGGREGGGREGGSVWPGQPTCFVCMCMRQACHLAYNLVVLRCYRQQGPTCQGVQQERTC